jgi:hypothetical protein
MLSSTVKTVKCAADVRISEVEYFRAAKYRTRRVAPMTCFITRMADINKPHHNLHRIQRYCMLFRIPTDSVDDSDHVMVPGSAILSFIGLVQFVYVFVPNRSLVVGFRLPAS